MIDLIVVHCSATREGKDFTVEDIRRWHKQRGFSDIGYHYVIYRDGTIKTGRSLCVAGAHCIGHNSNSIGVCYIGGLDSKGKRAKDTRTEAQKDALVALLCHLKRRFPKAVIHGHNYFANKACPSFNAEKEYEWLNK